MKTCESWKLKEHLFPTDSTSINSAFAFSEDREITNIPSIPVASERAMQEPLSHPW